MPVVKLYANLRTVAGQKELNIPARTVEEMLAKLTQNHPGLARFLYENGKLRPRVIVTVNGQMLDTAAVLNTSVSEQDQIAIFPPVAGG